MRLDAAAAMSWPALLLAVALIAIAACGDGGGETPAGFARIAETERIFSVDDLEAAGVKVNKQYDVSALPAASSAWHVILDSKEYEARFYPSHADLVAQGISMADEVTGPDALVNKGLAAWQEGYRDRKFCTKYPNTRCGAKYGDYVIRGNMILMCEGLDSASSLESCGRLLARIPDG